MGEEKRRREAGLLPPHAAFTYVPQARSDKKVGTLSSQKIFPLY